MESEFVRLADQLSKLRALVVKYFIAMEDASIDDILAYDASVTAAENELRAAVGYSAVTTLTQEVRR